MLGVFLCFQPLMAKIIFPKKTLHILTNHFSFADPALKRPAKRKSPL